MRWFTGSGKPLIFPPSWIRESATISRGKNIGITQKLHNSRLFFFLIHSPLIPSYSWVCFLLLCLSCLIIKDKYRERWRDQWKFSRARWCHSSIAKKLMNILFSLTKAISYRGSIRSGEKRIIYIFSYSRIWHSSNTNSITSQSLASARGTAKPAKLCETSFANKFWISIKHNTIHYIITEPFPGARESLK